MHIFSSDHDIVSIYNREGQGKIWFTTDYASLFLSSMAIVNVKLMGKNNTVVLPSLGFRFYYFTFGSFPANITVEAVGGLKECSNLPFSNVTNSINYAEIHNPVIRLRPSFILIESRLFVGFLVGAEINLIATSSDYPFQLVRGTFTFSAIG